MASVSKNLQAFKRQYKRTASVRSSALAAGYSENVANTGLAHMPKAIRTYVLSRRKKLSKLAQLARNVTPEEQENIMRGAIFANIAAGKDQATTSIKLGMQDKRVNMLGSDVQQGVFIIEMPAHLANRVQPKVIDGNAEQLLPATLPNP